MGIANRRNRMISVHSITDPVPLPLNFRATKSNLGETTADVKFTSQPSIVLCCYVRFEPVAARAHEKKQRPDGKAVHP